MKINEVIISKFRSINDGKFNISDIIALVGENNSGKSSIMRALNSFFNPSEEIGFYRDGTNLYTSKNAIPKITITFIDVPAKQVYTNHTNTNIITIRQKYNKSKKDFEYAYLDGSKYLPAPKELINELRGDIQFVLIPTFRNEKNTGQDDTSILKHLIDTFFQTHTSKRDTLSPKVIQAFDYFERHALNKISKGIEEKYLAKKGFSIKVDSKSNINYELLIKDLEIVIEECGKPFKLKECGSGVQSLVVISIYRYLADLTHTNYIIGIEEPETNLHPQAQKSLIYALFDEINDDELQLIFTTHSTVIVDELDHTKIVLVRKEADVKREFKTCLYQLNPNFWTKYNLQILQYDKFHKFRNSEFFFAKHVIVTESPIDSEVFRKLLKHKGITIERNSISIVVLDGITSLKYAFYLLRDLNIPKIIVVDKDFFFDYQHGSKNNSRYGNGVFNYSNSFKNDPLINDIFTNQTKRNLIESLLSTNHSRALDEILAYDILCMKYNLEMDLMASVIARNLTYDYLSIPTSDRSQLKLLTDYYKKIKKLDVLLNVIKHLPHKNLPNSYKRFIRRIKEVIS